MDKKQVAIELVRLAKELISVDTFKCPECGTKVLKQTGYCVKCKKKVKEASGRVAVMRNTPEFVLSVLNDWDGIAVRTFHELEKAGVLMEDKRDPMIILVGKKKLKAVGPGKGMYNMKWKII